MIKTLQKHGNSRALVFDKSMMEQLGITDESQLEVTIVGGKLTVVPTHIGVGEERVAASIANMRRNYDDMLKRLAK